MSDIEELIQGEIDHANTKEQSEELRRLLASDAGLRTRYEALAEVARALETAPVVDPPESLAPAVSQSIRGVSADLGRSAFSLQGFLANLSNGVRVLGVQAKERHGMNKRLAFGAIGLVAIAIIAYFGATGWPPALIMSWSHISCCVRISP